MAKRSRTFIPKSKRPRVGGKAKSARRATSVGGGQIAIWKPVKDLKDGLKDRKDLKELKDFVDTGTSIFKEAKDSFERVGGPTTPKNVNDGAATKIPASVFDQLLAEVVDESTKQAKKKRGRRPRKKAARR